HLGDPPAAPVGQLVERRVAAAGLRERRTGERERGAAQRRTREPCRQSDANHCGEAAGTVAPAPPAPSTPAGPPAPRVTLPSACVAARKWPPARPSASGQYSTASSSP